MDNILAGGKNLIKTVYSSDDNGEDGKFKTTRRVFKTILLILLRPLIFAPIFIILHQYLPNPAWPAHTDRILLGVLVFLLIEVLIYFLKKLLYILSLGFLIFLSYGTIWKGIGFVDFLDDYRAMIHNMQNSPRPEKELFAGIFPKTITASNQKVIDAVEYRNTIVRNYAVTAAVKNFNKANFTKKYLTVVQCFSIFKEVNAKWQYVYDPKGKDYIATASESVNLMAGDCDDYAIFMAACIKSVGGRARLIHAENHMYPELMIGNQRDLEAINYLIRRKFFVNESKFGNIHYHVEKNGDVWLNMDYTANYPGGKFLSQKIIGIINLDLSKQEDSQ